MIVEIMNIVAGLILAIGILPALPAIGKSLEKVAKWLGRFQTIIGIIAIIVGIVFFSLIQGTVAIIAGLILAMGILSSIPALGKYLENRQMARRIPNNHRNHRNNRWHTRTCRANLNPHTPHSFFLAIQPRKARGIKCEENSSVFNFSNSNYRSNNNSIFRNELEH